MKAKFALLLVAGALVALPVASANAGVVPSHGTYAGRTHEPYPRHIEFVYSGNTIQHFTLDGVVILHQGHVSNGQMRTSQNGVNFTATWDSPHHVVGTISVHHNGHLQVTHWDANQFAF